jgi:hypothetical protein
MPAACREHLRSLGVAVALLEEFFETYETNHLTLFLNHLTLFLWSEQTSIAYRKLEEAYQGLLAHSNAQEEAYQGLLAHSNALEGDYRKLEEAYQGLLAHSNALEEEYGRLLSAYTKSNKEHAGV